MVKKVYICPVCKVQHDTKKLAYGCMRQHKVITLTTWVCNTCNVEIDIRKKEEIEEHKKYCADYESLMMPHRHNRVGVYCL
jgi:hypothetical protein